MLSAATVASAVSEMQRDLIRRRVIRRLDVAGIRYEAVEVDADGKCDVDLARSGIRDLSPLRGLQIASLRIAFSDVRDLSPLAGMKLERLTVWAASVSDLSPLAGMPLQELNLGHCGNVRDLSPLRNMSSLRYLHLNYTGVRDLSPVGRLKLKGLSCAGTPVTDLAPLADMPLESLSFSPWHISRGLDVMRAKTTLKRIESEGDARAWEVGFIPAEHFWRGYDLGKALGDAGVESYKLEVDDDGMCRLDLSKAAVKSLEMLKPLTKHLVGLDLTKTAVTDLGPVSKAPLLYLNIYATGVTDLSPLADMPLEDLRLNPNRITAGLDALRKKRSLVRMGTYPGETMPPYAFWQKYDKGYFRRTLD